MKSWCLGRPSARFVAKMEDVLDVYQRPYNPQRPVVCMDEISKELHETPHGTLAMQPGQPQREDYEYSRRVCPELCVNTFLRWQGHHNANRPSNRIAN